MFICYHLRICRLIPPSHLIATCIFCQVNITAADNLATQGQDISSEGIDLVIPEYFSLITRAPIQYKDVVLPV